MDEVSSQKGQMASAIQPQREIDWTNNVATNDPYPNVDDKVTLVDS